MKIKTEFKEQIKRAFQNSPDAVKKQMRIALKLSMCKVQERARDKHRFKTHSGNLKRSISTKVVSEWPVEGEVYLDPSTTMITEGKWKGFSYGFFVHQGTKPHEIKPNKKQRLRWSKATTAGRKFVFAKRVKHPGTTQDPFILNALKKSRREINAVFTVRMQRAIKEAGL